MSAPLPAAKRGLAGDFDAGELLDPFQFGRQPVELVQSREVSKIRQHVEDPVIPHVNLARIG